MSREWMNGKIHQVACLFENENLDKAIAAFNQMLGTQPYDDWTIVENKELICANGEHRTDAWLRAQNYPFDNIQVEFMGTNDAPSGWSYCLEARGEKFGHFAQFSKDRDSDFAVAMEDGWERTLEGVEYWGGFINLEHPDCPWFYKEMYYIPGCDKWLTSPIPPNRTIADYLDDLMLLEVGVAVADVEEAVTKFCRLHGREVPQITEVVDADPEYKGESAGAIIKKSVKIVFEDIALEFYQPVNDMGIYKSWLEEKGEGISHFVFSVEDLPASIEKAKKQGLEVAQKGCDNYGEYVCLTYSEFPWLYIRLISK